MKLSLKIIKRFNNSTSNTSGSALSVVLFFSAIAMISLFSYVLHQMSYVKVSSRSPTTQQALFNARSGAYKAFYALIDSSSSDTLRTISTLDSSFGSELFGGIIDPDSAAHPTKPELDGVPVEYDLFEGDSINRSIVSLVPSGGTCLLLSTGMCGIVTRKVYASIGSPAPALPDTILVYHNMLEWSGNKPQGTLVNIPDKQPSLHTEWYEELTNRYQDLLTASESLLVDPPLLIQSSNDLHKVRSKVNGSLLIDGAGIGVRWKANDTILVRGDLQTTGEVSIDGITFIVGGEVKILDESQFEKVNIFSSNRVFIGDESSFQGNILSLRNITVYGKSSVKSKSSLIAGSTTPAVASGITTVDSLKFSILLSQETTIDAICIALATPGSIKTDFETTIKGILWAQHIVCHRGKMKGLIYASRVADCDDPVQMSTATSIAPAVDSTGKPVTSGALVKEKLYNSIPGELEPLADIGSYTLPFFIGKLSIVNWSEE